MTKLLVAMAWAYVVILMAVAEAMSPDGTVLGALFTLALYGALPLGIVLYVMGMPGRRAHRRAVERASSGSDPDGSGHPAGDPIAAKGEEA